MGREPNSVATVAQWLENPIVGPQSRARSLGLKEDEGKRWAAIKQRSIWPLSKSSCADTLRHKPPNGTPSSELCLIRRQLAPGVLKKKRDMKWLVTHSVIGSRGSGLVSDWLQRGAGTSFYHFFLPATPFNTGVREQLEFTVSASIIRPPGGRNKLPHSRPYIPPHPTKRRGSLNKSSRGSRECLPAANSVAAPRGSDLGIPVSVGALVDRPAVEQADLQKRRRRGNVLSPVLHICLRARSCEPMRVIEVSMELRRNKRAGETGDPRENPSANGIVQHDSHLRKSGVTRLGIAYRSGMERLCLLGAGNNHNQMDNYPAHSIVQGTTESGTPASMRVGACAQTQLYFRQSANANRVRFQAGWLPDFSMWESFRTMLLVGGFTRGFSVSTALAFQRSSILTSLHPHRLSRPCGLPGSWTWLGQPPETLPDLLRAARMECDLLQEDYIYTVITNMARRVRDLYSAMYMEVMHYLSRRLRLPSTWGLFPIFEVGKRGSDKGDFAKFIKCAFAAMCKVLNWRAVFSCCLSLHYKRTGETGDSQENPLVTGNVRHVPSDLVSVGVERSDRHTSSCSYRLPSRYKRKFHLCILKQSVPERYQQQEGKHEITVIPVTWPTLLLGTVAMAVKHGETYDLRGNKTVA
ncbi:hypothetical protein PR048_022662 [Dryococelus australis]|uniref:Uncharacterized protein n=1 Tax=Dryococelus australis TaxID=614101 RepID=A0ABQ9H1P6_9NEOP|nr:hypothetical protein PR048_022662 [Dryococelus australis]